MKPPAARLSPVCLLLLAAAALCVSARADRGLNEGIFRDRDDRQHPWSIQRSHLLRWNDQPYAPAGIVFHSEHLRAPSDESLRRDGEQMDTLRAAGIQDIWIEPGRGLLECRVQDIQALVDAAEARGMRYGLRVGDRTREPLIGFSPTLSPQLVPASRLEPGSVQRWEIRAPRARRVVYALVDAPTRTSSNWTAATGEVIVERDVAQIEARVRNSKLLAGLSGVLHVVPEVHVEPEELGSFGDLWAGMETYSERLKRHLLAVRFGAGLRFVLDPFSAGDGTVGQEDQVFPSSPSFRTAFEEWLRRRGGLNTVNASWRLNDTRLTALDEAARLVPMWSRNDPPEGDGWLFDPVERTAYRCRPRECSIWSDLDEFRAVSLKRWMNVITSTLKQEGLNVPMLFTWSAYHPLFTNSPSPAGYDGLAAHLYGAPATMARESAAYALAQCEESDRETWLIAARMAGPRGANGEPAPLDAASASAAWEAVRAAGFRGVYLDPRQTPGAVSLAKGLAGDTAAAAAGLQEKVRVCFFPMSLAGADRVSRLSNGVWWLPSALPARLLRYGDAMMGYEIERPFGDEHVVRKGTVLWSTAGTREVTFHEDKLFPVEIYDSAGMPVKIRVRKNQIRVMLTEEPLVVTGPGPYGLFPLELAATQLQEFDLLLREAEAQKLNSAALRSIYAQAEKALAPGSAASIYQAITPYVERLRQELTPFIWLEGEHSASHSLTGIAFQAGASGGTYLKLDRGQASVSGTYKARYVVEIRRDASYEIWVAGRVPGRPGVSPLIWQVDEEPAVQVKTAAPAGPDYAPGLAWFSLGRVTLKQGKHELLVVFPDPADGPGGRYSAAIDALVFSRDAFRPQGIEKPSPRSRAAR